MDDNASKSSTSLVVAEKNVRKPGGCVGIFCKLFDWNRRFAKKKLFPKKLLAPSRGNKVSKTLANESLLKTKHLLTDDDANGKHEMSSPGLVARLMGLDSLPVVKRQSADESPFCGNGKPKNVGLVQRSDKEVVNLEKGRLIKGYQPQKIHKTGLFERRPVNRFGADAMHIKNVLSRSKKRHPKLTSPVKSSRATKNTIRLIGAATKILEPGLQATSRAKCALTYSNHMPKQPMDDEFIRAKTVINLPVQSSSQVAVQSSCRNCGHALEGMKNFTRDANKKIPTHCDRESEVVLLRSRYQPEEMPFALNGKKHSGFNCNSFIHQQRDASPSVALNNTGSVSSTTAFSDKKEFIAMNRNMSHSQFRFPRKSQYQVPEDNAFSSHGNMRTKKTSSACRHVECSSSSSSVMDRERCLDSEHMAGRRPRFGNPTCAKSQPSVSFSFNSTLKPPCGSSAQRLIKESNHGEKTASPLLMNEDAIGTILAHTLKELAIQGESESTEITPQGRTASAILQELISVLTAQRPISPELNKSISSYTATAYKPSQADARGKRLPMMFPGNHSSPGSVLDASFSNDSCVSSSIDDSSGNMLQSDFMDFYDSETSLNNRETYCIVPVSHLLDHISRALDRTKLPEMKLCTAYSAYTKEVLFNCELLFGNANKSETFVDFLMGPFLNELEALAIAAWRDTVISGFQVLNRGDINNPIRKFLLDCLVECLSIRYDRYSNSGFMEWCRLPRHLNPEALILLFDYEVRKSASLARMTTDEIIDWEMNASLAKWADFELEMFECGAEIGLIIFQGLVDEIVADFVLSS
ncbi:hypothetical protein V2J09_012641 [Rumex salicifolius]